MELENNVDIDIHTIKNMCKHRYPFLMVDRIVGLVPGKSATAVKYTTYNESFYQGHFPEFHVMPGVIQLEIMAQTAGMPFFLTKDENSPQGYRGLKPEEGKSPMIVGTNKVKFKKLILPGNLLISRTFVTKSKMDILFSNNTLHIKNIFDGTEELASQAETIIKLGITT